ncbi:MAG: hypothetical protein H7062_17720 [Candidatus Saccharimonas sp.]|nr:hypothetical protein [Planctomycetaceae bacterium]
MSEEAHPAWWKPWNWPWSVWGLVVVLMLALLPFVVRAFCLSAVPVMAEPFDMAAFVGDEIPPDENAFTEYRQVYEMRKVLMQGLQQKSASEPGNYEDVYKGGWEAADDAMRAELEAHRQALVVWRRGTEKSRALDVLPSEMTFGMVWGTSQDLQHVTVLALVDQMRCLHEGNADEAWKLARAAYRSGGHVSRRGVVIAGLFSTVIHDMSSEGMQRWAEHPAVTADQLRAGLANVTADFALYEPESNLLRTDYVVLRSSLSRPQWAGMMGSNFGTPLIDKIVPASVASGFMWMVGEPELTIRITRQIVANQIREVDKPLAERRQLAGSGTILLFDTDPAVTLVSGELNAKQIDGSVKTSILAKMLLPATMQLDDAYMRFRGRQAALEVMLAAQAYRRDKGEFPESLDALVPQYLEAVPLDPCDRNGGRIRYRRDSTTNAVVWSSAQDGNDDGGAVETGKSRTADVGFLLK